MNPAVPPRKHGTRRQFVPRTSRTARLSPWRSQASCVQTWPRSSSNDRDTVAVCRPRARATTAEPGALAGTTPSNTKGSRSAAAGANRSTKTSPPCRYLAGQVGRPWAKVHADICRHLDRDNPVQDHVRDHLEDFVAIDVMVQGNNLVHAGGYRVGQKLYSLFYVCPSSGLLKKTRRPKSPYRHLPDPVRLFPNGDESALVRFRGEWLVVGFNEMAPYDPRGEFLITFGTPFSKKKFIVRKRSTSTVARSMP